MRCHHPETAELTRRRAVLVGASSMLVHSRISQGLRAATPNGPSGPSFSKLETDIQSAIAAGDLPGAVVGMADQTKVRNLRAFGQRAVSPQAEQMTVDTLFDLASLTKPIATATAIHRLVQGKRIAWDDRVVKHWPEFHSQGKDAITIRDCLLHRSGLTPDNALSDYLRGVDEAWRRIAELPLRSQPGERFAYSDVGFLVLGKVVERVSGQSLDEFASDQIFEPLKMADTGFRPERSNGDRTAPTEQWPQDEPMSAEHSSKWLRGVVHDPRARALGGVAGHAGLFSTASDLLVFGQQMLRCCLQDAGTTLVDRSLMTQVVSPTSIPNGPDRPVAQRGLGWDMDSPYSINRPTTFTKASFGHGGFTGTVLWIDPRLERVFVFLSSRLHPDGKGRVNRLASRVGDHLMQDDG